MKPIHIHSSNWTREYQRGPKDYWMERDDAPFIDTRPISCKIVCAYGTYDGRLCIKDPLNCIDIFTAGRWHCILRTYDNERRTLQVLPL